MAKSKHYYIRKAHRYLGVLLGIQFLFWTISGLYFSWSDMDEIHGDFEKRKPQLLRADISVVSPSDVIKNVRQRHIVDSIVSLQLIDILGKPVYQLRYVGAEAHTGKHAGHPPQHSVILAEATTGQVRNALSEKEAVALASRRFNGEPNVKSIAYLKNTDSHHEYRENPLPAYAVTFDNAANTTVYVAAELGTVQSFRNNKWRIFDFLWMTHTMDYQSRDNIGNILLRIFSIFGLVTVVSGFALYFMSSKRFRKHTRPSQ
mgnify:CR=1 FL=1